MCRASGSRGKGATVSVTCPETAFSSLAVRVRDTAFLGNELVVRLAAEPKVDVRPHAGASAGRVVTIMEPDGALSGTVSLDAGSYEVNVISRAFSDGANSLWLEVDGRRCEDPIHIRTDGLGDSSRHHALPPDLSRVQMRTGGAHTFVLTLREAPGPELDKIQFLKGGKVVREIECEDLVRQADAD